ncbi:helix-turn-helix domain-containing protein [Spirosoma radiotolerans]|uniref:AraC family transcriptional regulator n=1 Tax=Spirosoma radiotolerans TaxID=1379870 RepID=A0A0E3ZT67_9BACT|nr:helix-turn-helix transcriptional regulator [Spirosoma radiotolerans]AKD53875.1 AraC family transcriptional regulator [Spirosoma radiotolerans]
MSQPIRLKSIQEFHQRRGLPQSAHPLISVVNIKDITIAPDRLSVNDFYCISIKRIPNARYRYGQQVYDFTGGVLFFTAPGQVIGFEMAKLPTDPTGWLLLIHPDFLWGTPLARTIKKYEFFNYSADEALFLSEKEEKTIDGIISQISQEYQAAIDPYSQGIILAQIELLLNYAERFYNRQFITRKISNHQLLNRLDDLLNDYFNREEITYNGLPTVQTVCNQLNISVSYLSRVLKLLTGQSTQQHIHGKLIERAKEKLTTTDLSVSEIAFALGFEHPQSFNKLFKAKTNTTPLAFRTSFN